MFTSYNYSKFPVSLGKKASLNLTFHHFLKPKVSSTDMCGLRLWVWNVRMSVTSSQERILKCYLDIGLSLISLQTEMLPTQSSIQVFTLNTAGNKNLQIILSSLIWYLTKLPTPVLSGSVTSLSINHYIFNFAHLGDGQNSWIADKCHRPLLPL